MKAISVVFCGIVLTSCSRLVSGPSPLPASLYTAGPASGGYKLLYSFKGDPDGAIPEANLLDVNGELYGTTFAGGGGSGISNTGTVYKVSTAGGERVVYQFKGEQNDGRNPTTPLVDVNGSLYGTTESSEYTDDGTVFSVTTSGRERLVYRFNYSVDGGGPQGLIAVKNALYGTMKFGSLGKNCGPPSNPGCGTVFVVETNGKEHVVYTFGHALSGRYPSGPPVYLNGRLYGTTEGGGKYGFGTIFAVTTAGKERVVYNFKGAPDGRDPHEIIAVNGVLYGTSEYGGAHNLGTVFRVMTTGQERVLYSFRGPGDGQSPPHDGAYPFLANLVSVQGSLYGTTPEGGIGDCSVFSQTIGCGTVFAVAMSGAERVLYRFKGGADDGEPFAGLTYLHGRLYGTTAGFANRQNGTVFSVLP